MLGDHFVKFEKKKRSKSLDVIKGILIFCVVLGHYDSGNTHDTIFLFHMPLFFILSGLFLDRNKLLSKNYLWNKCITLLTPYIAYLVVDTVLTNRIYSIKSFIKILWGGRAISGTYWYITCFVFTLFLLKILLKYTHESSSEKSDIRIGTLIFVGGGYSSN